MEWKNENWDYKGHWRDLRDGDLYCVEEYDLYHNNQFCGKLVGKSYLIKKENRASLKDSFEWFGPRRLKGNDDIKDFVKKCDSLKVCIDQIEHILLKKVK